MSAAAGGHIRKRGNNSFELRWRVAGKIKTETIRGTLADAKRALRKRLTEADQGISPGRGTVGEWLTRWLAIVEPEISRCTYVTWLSHVKCYLRPEFGDIAFAKLTADRLQQGWSRLALRIQPSTLKVVRLTMSNCLSRAVELRVLSYNPAAGLRRRATRTAAPPEMAILSPDQIAPLIDAARPTHLFAPVLLGLIGLRRGETAALRWRNVDLDRGTVTVSESMREPDAAHRSIGATKSGAGRRVALPAFIAAELKAWRNRQREEFLRLGARVGRDLRMYPP